MAGTKGHSGGIPIPTALMKKRNSKRHEYRDNKDEPKPKLGTPPCPKWLDKEATAEWRRVAPELTRMGVLAEIERGALTGYCRNWSAFKDRSEMLEKTGWTLARANGDIVANPVVKQMNEAQMLMLRFAQELGLTPSSRTRVHATPQEQPKGGVGKFFGETG